jgi:hypothetical protein
MGFEPVRGFFTRFARFDPGLTLELALAAGADRGDERVDDLANWISSQQTDAGLWRYEANPNASRWVSYRLLTALRRLDSEPTDGEWVSTEPRTPFVPYMRSRKRF